MVPPQGFLIWECTQGWQGVKKAISSNAVMLFYIRWSLSTLNSCIICIYCVRCHVLLDYTLVAEILTTWISWITFILLCDLSQLLSKTTQCETFTALITWMMFHSYMGCHMFLSDYSCGWNTYHYDYINTFNSYVCCHVYYQTTPPVETLTMLITKMIFFTCVGCHMCYQMTSPS